MGLNTEWRGGLQKSSLPAVFYRLKKSLTTFIKKYFSLKLIRLLAENSNLCKLIVIIILEFQFSGKQK